MSRFASTHTANPAAARKRLLALVHIARASLGWSKQQYVQHIMGEWGVDSASGLSDAQLEQLIAHFKSLGFKVKASSSAKAAQPKPAREQPLQEPMHRKLRAMWYALADVGAVERPASAVVCDRAIEAWGKRMINEGSAHQQVGRLDALRFASWAQLCTLIEDLKRWGQRVKAQID